MDTSAPTPESATAPTPEPAAAAPPPVFFRGGKKKRAFRQRAEEPDTEPTAQTDSATTINTSSDATAKGQAGTSTTDPAVSGTPATTTTAATAARRDEDDKQEGGLSVAEVLRLRNAKKHRLGGVAFRAGDEAGATVQKNSEQAMVLHDGVGSGGGGGGGGGEVQEAAILGGVAKRFAPQTGMVGELVNRHMEEYIESELARRKRLAAEHRAQQEGAANSSSNAMTSSMTNLLAADPTLSVGGGKVESQRALHGKLMEIDLGEEARARNIAETERARRRLEGQILEEEEDADGRRKKVRLGPDGKPWRSRNRRDSDALKRDQQVEEFLRENRLDVYDVPSDQPEYAAGLEDDEMAADDRIAEEFRRDFMDAMSQRHRRRRPAVNATARPSARNQDAEILKGPKLGGSRNARAAMREKLLREQEQQKKR